MFCLLRLAEIKHLEICDIKDETGAMYSSLLLFLKYGRYFRVATKIFERLCVSHKKNWDFLKVKSKVKSVGRAVVA